MRNKLVLIQGAARLCTPYLHCVARPWGLLHSSTSQYKHPSAIMTQIWLLRNWLKQLECVRIKETHSDQIPTPFPTISIFFEGYEMQLFNDCMANLTRMGHVIHMYEWRLKQSLQSMWAGQFIVYRNAAPSCTRQNTINHTPSSVCMCMCVCVCARACVCVCVRAYMHNIL